jgi:hypothetical protein
MEIVEFDGARMLDIALKKRGKSTSFAKSVPRAETGSGLSMMDYSNTA